jgi:hypothetical protein
MITNIGFKHDSDSEEEKEFDLHRFNGTSEPYVMEGV